MLVLSRKRNQSIVINGNIVITVVNVKGGKVHLGVDAPREVTVHREEVFDAISSGDLPVSSDPTSDGTRVSDNDPVSDSAACSSYCSFSR